MRTVTQQIFGLKKLITLCFLLSFFAISHAQYASIDAILTKLENRKGINQLDRIDISDKKFILIEEFPDHTERSFVIINGKELTYVEIFDDKETKESSSNVFTGDVLQSKLNMVSIRADLLEGKKISIPLTKTFFATKQDNILYLIDINTRKRWVDEIAFNKKK